MNKNLSKINWCRYYLRIMLAVALVLVSVPLFPLGLVKAGTPDDSYTIERYYTENVNQQTTTSITFQDALTLTFTSPATKNYLVSVSALLTNSSTLYNTVAQLTIDGTTYSETWRQPNDATIDWRSFGAHKVIQLSGGSHTVKIQYRTENVAGTAYIKRAAINVMEVTNYYTAEQETEISTTSTSYVDAGTAVLTFTPPAQADYLMLLTANVVTDTSGKSVWVQWMIDGTPDSEFEEPSTNYMSWGVIELENLTAASHTFKIQYRAERTAFIKNARIIAVLLSDLGGNQYAESEAESVTQSTTYVDKTTLSFTPATRGDYLRIISGMGRQESSSYAFYANQDVDGTSGGEYAFLAGSDKIYRTFMMVGKTNFSAALHNIKIQWRTNNAAANSEAFIKEANAIALQVDTAESYNDSAHTTVDDSFGPGENTVYVWAHGLRASQTYAVAYYDASPTGGGQKVATDSGLTSTAYGNLSSQYLLTTDPSAVAGIWHAVVFDTEFGSPPTNYSDVVADGGYVVEDSFEATAAAIPEFPTVVAAIAVAGLCFAAYFWMRKRRLAYVRVTS